MDAASLKAAGFSDQEIRLHQAGFSDAEIKAQTAPAKQPSYLDELGRGLYNLPRSGVDLLHNVETQFGPDGLPAHVLAHPVQSWHDATVTVPDKIASVLGGAMQHVREMSPADQQGSAPKMDTTDFDNMLAAAKQKFGTGHRIASTIADDPAPVLATVLDPALRAAGVRNGVVGAVASAADKAKAVAAAAPAVAKASDVVDATLAPIRTIATAGRRANAAADTMSADATSRLTDAQAAQAADASAATDRAARASALADRARAQGKSLNDRASAAAAEATPPVPDVGTPAHLSDIGDSIRQPALANEDAINAKMRDADEQYRTAMQAVADDRASSNVGVSDMPLAKAMIKQSQAVVQPNAVTRPSVGAVPADSAGAKLHKQLLDVLQPQQVPLSDVEAAKAVKAGVDVQTGADGSKFRVVKPSLQNVDDFRRYVGKVLNGQVDGYEAINANDARAMYGNLSKVIDKYVSGASAPVQANWRAGKQALSPFENVRAGKAIVGTQPGTDVSAVPAAALPGRIMAGGRDTLKQAAAVAGPAPVNAALRSQVQNTLAGAKSADAAEAMVAPGTKLGDAVNTDDDLTAAVRDHIAQVRQAEAQGQAATDLTRRSATSMSRADMLDKAANALQGTAEGAISKARGYQQELSSLSVAQPREVGSKYVSVLNRAHADGTITTEQLNDGLQLAAGAEKAFALKATRDAWLRQAAITMGVSGLGAAGVGILHTAGH